MYVVDICKNCLCEVTDIDVHKGGGGGGGGGGSAGERGSKLLVSRNIILNSADGIL